MELRTDCDKIFTKWMFYHTRCVQIGLNMCLLYKPQEKSDTARKSLIGQWFEWNELMTELTTILQWMEMPYFQGTLMCIAPYNNVYTVQYALHMVHTGFGKKNVNKIRRGNSLTRSKRHIAKWQLQLNFGFRAETKQVLHKFAFILSFFGWKLDNEWWYWYLEFVNITCFHFTIQNFSPSVLLKMFRSAFLPQFHAINSTKQCTMCICKASKNIEKDTAPHRTTSSGY